jgi:hypothetical protein
MLSQLRISWTWGPLAQGCLNSANLAVKVGGSLHPKKNPGFILQEAKASRRWDITLK